MTLRFLDSATQPAGLLLAVVAAVATGLLYLRETRHQRQPYAWSLPLLRTLAILLVAAMLLRPVLFHRERTGELGRVVVAIDDSASMERADPSTSSERKRAIAASLGWIEPNGSATEATPQPLSSEVAARFDRSTRRRRLRAAVFESNLLNNLATEHDVAVVALRGSTAARLAAPPPGERFEPPTDEPADATDLATPLLSAAGNGSPQAVVLLTDGQHNAGPSPLQTATLLRQQGIPLHVVAFGPDAAPPDLAVVDIAVPESVGRRDRLAGSVELNDTLTPGDPFELTITSDGVEVWSQSLVAAGQGRRSVEFDLSAETLLGDATERDRRDGPAGVRRQTEAVDLAATVRPAVADAEPGNDRRETRLHVRLSRQSALLIDGRPRWESRYVRNAFERDPQWELTAIVAAPGEPIERSLLPADEDGWFAFDVVILGEIPSDRFAADDLQSLRAFVDRRGGGLVTIDGTRGWFESFAKSPLGDLLPYRRRGPADRACDAIRLTEAGRNAPAMRLLPSEEANKAIWRELAPPRTPILGEPLSGAEVLLEGVLRIDGQERGVPLLVDRPFGAGRVLSLATDETWRWRYKVADKWHDAFWKQLVGSAMPPTFAVENDFVAIDAGRPRYAPGESATLRVKLTEPDGGPATDSIVSAILQTDDGRRRSVRLVADEQVPGLYRGQSGPLDSGRTTVTVEASGFSGDSLQPETGFLVAPRDSQERGTTTADAALLRELAEASGGTFRREEDIGQLRDVLAPLSRGRAVETERRLNESFWTFAAILSLLGLEWGLRKRCGLP